MQKLAIKRILDRKNNIGSINSLVQIEIDETTKEQMQFR